MHFLKCGLPDLAEVSGRTRFRDLEYANGSGHEQSLFIDCQGRPWVCQRHRGQVPTQNGRSAPVRAAGSRIEESSEGLAPVDSIYMSFHRTHNVCSALARTCYSPLPRLPHESSSFRAPERAALAGAKRPSGAVGWSVWFLCMRDLYCYSLSRIACMSTSQGRCAHFLSMLSVMRYDLSSDNCQAVPRGRSGPVSALQLIRLSTETAPCWWSAPPLGHTDRSSVPGSTRVHISPFDPGTWRGTIAGCLFDLARSAPSRSHTVYQHFCPSGLPVPSSPFSCRTSWTPPDGKALFRLQRHLPKAVSAGEARVAWLRILELEKWLMSAILVPESWWACLFGEALARHSSTLGYTSRNQSASTAEMVRAA